MKILFIQHKNFINGSGGTEKICSFLANGLSDLGHTVEIATNQNIEGRPIFPLNKEVLVTNIFDENISQIELKETFNYNGSNPLKWIFYKIKKKSTKRENKRLIKQIGGNDELFTLNLHNRSKAWKSYIDSLHPDIIITMSISSLLEITFRNEYQIPIVNSTNGRPDYDYSDILWHRSEKEMSLLKESYKKLSAIQVLFDNYKEFLPETFQGKSITISNPVPQIEVKQIVNHLVEKERYKIINIASLAIDCKQQHIAINIFAKIAHKYPNWDLYFWGTGQDYNVLYNQIEEVGLRDRIFLKGFTANPLEELETSDIFIFPSKYEGFPLALTEGMSIGLPSIGFKTCSGVNELIKHNENGFLATTELEMMSNLEALMQDNTLRQTLGESAHLSMKKYDKKSVSQLWKTLIDSFM
ncbi:glycosyltransferase [Chryseobacterium sp. ERMR1:04]|uniref:glycosyltransferase n=1 Tax=Chryseobacterium sp. ERMR1:04 TaxID=1705393 RepID=UPI0006C88654|nr:glycosyltransferase [Chryseobacterium sp. ERMR1:04]KPH12275.1 glycosyltransferase [Chryseobacterium sp. ERMR1:04]